MEQSSRTQKYYFPTTRRSLLSCCRLVSSTRWGEFVKKYHNSMLKYLRGRWGGLDEFQREDVVQDTFVQLAQLLPTYSYDRTIENCFRRFLLSVLEKCALHYWGRLKRKKRIELEFSDKESYLEDMSSHTASAHFRDDVMGVSGDEIRELAENLILKDNTLSIESRQIFWRIEINGEKPADIAKEFNKTRDAVDHDKARVKKKLQQMARKMLKISGAME